MSNGPIRLLQRALTILATTIAVIEIAGLALGTNEYFWFARQLFLSVEAIRPVGTDGLWTYAPNRKIISAATYRLSEAEVWVEYFCPFKTNRLGLIDTNFDEERHSQIDVLVVGDSFLEGQGGCPWLTRTDLSPSSPIVVNGGLQGASIRSMELLEAWVSTQLSVKKLVVVAISNDFKRTPPSGANWASRAECMVQGHCQPGVDYIWTLGPDATPQTLAERSRHFPDPSRATPWQQIASTLLFHSMTWEVVNRLQALLHPPTGASEDAAYAVNFAALGRLREKYPDLRILLVPQKDEVGFLGIENSDSARVKSFLVRERFSFHTCPLSLGDFMPIDGHPNASGYRKMRKCLDLELGAFDFEKE